MAIMSNCGEKSESKITASRGKEVKTLPAQEAIPTVNLTAAEINQIKTQIQTLNLYAPLNAQGITGIITGGLLSNLSKTGVASANMAELRIGDNACRKVDSDSTHCFVSIANTGSYPITANYGNVAIDIGTFQVISPGDAEPSGFKRAYEFGMFDRKFARKGVDCYPNSQSNFNDCTAVSSAGSYITLDSAYIQPQQIRKISIAGSECRILKASEVAIDNGNPSANDQLFDKPFVIPMFYSVNNGAQNTFGSRVICQLEPSVFYGAFPISFDLKIDYEANSTGLKSSVIALREADFIYIGITGAPEIKAPVAQILRIAREIKSAFQINESTPISPSRLKRLDSRTISTSQGDKIIISLPSSLISTNQETITLIRSNNTQRTLARFNYAVDTYLASARYLALEAAIRGGSMGTPEYLRLVSDPNNRSNYIVIGYGASQLTSLTNLENTAKKCSLTTNQYAPRYGLSDFVRTCATIPTDMFTSTQVTIGATAKFNAARFFKAEGPGVALGLDIGFFLDDSTVFHAASTNRPILISAPVINRAKATFTIDGQTCALLPGDPAVLKALNIPASFSPWFSSTRQDTFPGACSIPRPSTNGVKVLNIKFGTFTAASRNIVFDSQNFQKNFSVPSIKVGQAINYSTGIPNIRNIHFLTPSGNSFDCATPSIDWSKISSAFPSSTVLGEGLCFPSEQIISTIGETVTRAEITTDSGDNYSIADLSTVVNRNCGYNESRQLIGVVDSVSQGCVIAKLGIGVVGMSLSNFNDQVAAFKANLAAKSNVSVYNPTCTEVCRERGGVLLTAYNQESCNRWINMYNINAPLNATSPTTKVGCYTNHVNNTIASFFGTFDPGLRPTSRTQRRYCTCAQ